MQTLRSTPIKVIDAVLIRIELFIDGENKNVNGRNVELKFIQTNNRIELNIFTKKSKSEMTTTQCRNALKNLKSNDNSIALTKIAFPNYSSDDQKTAKEIFNYQVLLVDKSEPDLVVTCN